MNKTEKLICLVLGLVLVWYVWSEMGKAKERQCLVMTEDGKSESVVSNGVCTVSNGVGVNDDSNSIRSYSKFSTNSVDASAKALPTVPEEFVTLENDAVRLSLSSRGAVVKQVTLKKYAKRRGEVSEENPAVVFDFSASPLGELSGVAGLEPNASYEVKSVSSNAVVFANAIVTRTVTLKADYQIVYAETFHYGVNAGTAHADAKPVYLGLGAMKMGDSKNDLLSVDSFALDAGNGKPGVVHHGDDDSPLKPYLIGGLTGGCSGSKDAAGMPETQDVAYPGVQHWIAIKNRFFVVAMASCSETNMGFVGQVTRDMNATNYRPQSIAASIRFHSTPETRTTTFYVGPKKQSLLWDLEMKDVMEFGMWRWLCYPLVWVLNFFHGWIPNFGVAIILLTILVRIIFWPLTHKSTIGMKKMQEIQPKMKALQAQFKGNPQRLQQETWALYKAEKVNPMSSCLPMLIQIPVFIALFNVLRSAVELRYAPFLWIGDLSEPEALFSSWFPFGGLNILPVLMAVSTGLQSAFTPSSGDKNQQKMMMVFMPIMMLVMFYSFPSALSLYWFLSNLFSIVQMWIIRRQTAKEQQVLMPNEIIDPPTTRQMKRHG